MVPVIRALPALSLCLTLTLPAAAFAQEDWPALSQQAVALFQQGDQDQAVVLARKALALAESSKEPRNIATQPE
jgi:Flp pilus assembly protein TadD